MFERIFICEQVSLNAGGLSLHRVSQVFAAETAAIMFYCRLTRMPFDLSIRYTVEIMRMTAGGFAKVLNAEQRLLSMPSRLYPKQLMYVYSPPGGLQAGHYGVSIELATKQRADTEFLVV